MKLKITTLNLEGFDNWEERSPKIEKYLREVDSDVVVFQEAVFLPSLSPHNQAQLLNQTLHYPYEISTISRQQVGVKYPVYREGLAVLSKHPITSSDTLILKKLEGDEHDRILQLVDVMIDGQTIRIGNIHFSVTDAFDYATPQLEETLNILKARDEKRILIGDFNLVDIESSGELWKEGYKASVDTPYVSFPQKNSRIDYALIPNEFDLKSIKTSGDGLSDHRAVSIEVEIN